MKFKLSTLAVAILPLCASANQDIQPAEKFQNVVVAYHNNATSSDRVNLQNSLGAKLTNVKRYKNIKKCNSSK